MSNVPVGEEKEDEEEDNSSHKGTVYTYIQGLCNILYNLSCKLSTGFIIVVFRLKSASIVVIIILHFKTQNTLLIMWSQYPTQTQKYLKSDWFCIKTNKQNNNKPTKEREREIKQSRKSMCCEQLTSAALCIICSAKLFLLQEHPRSPWLKEQKKNTDGVTNGGDVESLLLTFQNWEEQDMIHEMKMKNFFSRQM